MATEERIMKLFTPLSIGVLTLLLGAPAFICAQDDAKPKQEDAKPEEKPRQADEDKTKDVKPPEKHDDMKPQDAKPQDIRPEDNKHQEDMKRDEARPQDHPEAHDNGRPAGKRVDRIPDDKFRSNFGREHVTVINRPVIVEGHPSFQFGGYWFGIATPWPAEWSYTDQVYVDYIDGEYFLFDVLHPGVRLELIVTM
jgi:hypothetical protein